MSTPSFGLTNTQCAQYHANTCSSVLKFALKLTVVDIGAVFLESYHTVRLYDIYYILALK